MPGSPLESYMQMPRLEGCVGGIPIRTKQPQHSLCDTLFLTTSSDRDLLTFATSSRQKGKHERKNKSSDGTRHIHETSRLILPTVLKARNLRADLRSELNNVFHKRKHCVDLILNFNI